MNRAPLRLQYWVSEYSYDPRIDYSEFRAQDLILLGMVEDPQLLSQKTGRIKLSDYLATMKVPGLWSKDTLTLVRKAYRKWDLKTFIIPVYAKVAEQCRLFTVGREDGTTVDYADVVVFGGWIKSGNAIVSRAYYLMERKVGDGHQNVLIQFAVEDESQLAELQVAAASSVGWHIFGEVETVEVPSPKPSTRCYRKIFRRMNDDNGTTSS